MEQPESLEPTGPALARPDAATSAVNSLPLLRYVFQPFLFLASYASCLALLVPALTVVKWAVVLHGNVRCFSDDSENENGYLFLLYGVMALLAAMIACALLVVAHNSHLQLISMYAFIMWFAMWGRSLRFGLECAESFDRELKNATQGFYTVPWGVTVVVMPLVILFHVKAFQAASLSETRTGQWLPRIIVGLMLSALLYALSIVLEHYTRHSDDVRWLVFTCLGLVVVMYLAYIGTATSFFVHVLQLADEAARLGEGRMRDDAVKAKKAVAIQLIGMLASMFTSGLAVVIYVLVKVLKVQIKSSSDWLHITAIVDAFANLMGALALSGAFTGALHKTFAASRADAARSSARKALASTWQSDPDPRWHCKVEELAGRGFTLEALLEFYKGLGTKYMMHYDSSCHTTADVVRQAIIPLSASQSCAYSSIMMGGKHTKPMKMVTHWWGNLFGSLIAAIVADALEEPEYAMVAYMLDHKFEQLVQWVQSLGKQHITYWVCAFSVNQHAGICGGNPGRDRDPVTGEVHPVCPCRMQKAWNDTPPLHKDGKRSISCEMNKFNDMMKLLAAQNQGFLQVVAIDRDFKTFSRAWCVAELAAASTMNMSQYLKVPSQEALNTSTPLLKELRIENMQASRQEDKDDILAMIDDKAKFNTDLQSLLFQRLFPGWKSLDTVDMMGRIGRIARWQQLLGQMGFKELMRRGGRTSPEIAKPSVSL